MVGMNRSCGLRRRLVGFMIALALEPWHEKVGRLGSTRSLSINLPSQRKEPMREPVLSSELLRCFKVFL